MILRGWLNDTIVRDTPFKLQAGRIWLKNAVRMFVASRALW